MWKTIEFNTRDQLDDWIAQWGHRTRWNEVFINNGYGVEFMRLRSI
jgi:hypothetical protein